MARLRYLAAGVLDELSRVFQLVPRGNNGINCGNSPELPCLKCLDGESWQFSVPLYCAQCAISGCRTDAEAESHKGGGGIIGGIICWKN